MKLRSAGRLEPCRDMPRSSAGMRSEPEALSSSGVHPEALTLSCAGAQVWSVGQPTPNFTLEGHEKGVNCVDYFVGGAHLLQTSL